VSKSREGPSEDKSVSSSPEGTINSDVLPPMPAPVKKTSSTPKSPFPFLGPPQLPDELGRLEKFRVLRQLGKGGMGIVFLGEDCVLHRQVALKVMLPELAANQEASERFLREARAIAKVRHERIVTLFDVSEADGVPFLVMELLEGMTLHDYLRASKRLTLAQIARIGKDIASGLAAAHRHGVIHRDIKPGNIWLETPSGNVKILDFGLARMQSPDQMSSVSGGILGTPAYMSPEQALGSPLDARSDLFSVGTVLYQLCTGRLPFVGATMFELLEAIARSQPKPVLTWHPAVPTSLAELIHHLHQKRPEHRPSSALVVAERLDDILLNWPPMAQQISAVQLVSAPPLPNWPTAANETGPSTSGDEPTPPLPPPAPPQGGYPPRTPPPPPPPPPPIQTRPNTPPPRPHQIAAEGSPLAPTGGGGVPSHSSRKSSNRPFLFGFMGALGCLLAAMIVEAPYQMLLPASASKSALLNATPVLKVDVVFVLDATLLMDPYVAMVRDNADKFFANLKKENVDGQVGLVTFRDRIDIDPGMDNLKGSLFDGKPFTADPEKFRREVSAVTAWGGGDEPESGLDALDYASKLPFRDGAAKVLILVTDAPPRVPDKENRDENQVAEKLATREVRQLHLFVANDTHAKRYLTIQKALGTGDRKGGNLYKFSDLDPTRLGEMLTGALVKQIAQSAREQSRVRAVASEGEFARGDTLRLIFATGLWTVFIAQGVGFALLLTSVLCLGQSLRRVFSFWKAALTIVVGLLAGCLAQALVVLLTMGAAPGAWNAISDLIAKLFAWTLIGALVGFGVAFFLPGLSKPRGVIGGAVGGVFGALLYVVFSTIFGSMLGRWLGALALGFCLGLFLALIENVFRRWWLEVRFSSGEVRTITLGPQLVSIGSDPGRATVVLPDGPPIAFRFYLDRDKVYCEDHEGSFEIVAGEKQRVGDVSIILCSPESAGHIGVVLELDSGRFIPLSEGLPLTAEDIPGLHSSYPDGTVALVSPKTAEPDLLLLFNRSKEEWRATDANGITKIIYPDLGVTLNVGTRINFGRVQGELAGNGR